MREAQAAAAQVLARVHAGRTLDTELAALWRGQPTADATWRALTQDLTYGVLRHRGELEARLDVLANKPLRDAEIKQLLLVGLYQLHHTRAAAHAVVDQAVGACALLDTRSAKATQGLINAVLRASQRRRAELDELMAQSETARYSFPQWWINKLKKQYPADHVAMLEAGNRHAPLTLRVNARRTARDAYLKALAAAGIAAQALESHAVVLDKPVPVSRLPGFAGGLVSVQDASAQRAAPLLDAQDGMRVLDACAAPGGKSAHVLELANVELTAIDIDESRLLRVTDNLRRLGLKAKTLTADAADPDHWWDGALYERILADVPCSAAGVTRRHPDIKWLRRESDIAQFAGRQQTMMDALWRLLAPGGKFLYVTCSVFREENHEQIARFTGHHADARRLPLPGEFPVEHAGQILPDAVHDGFFYALLQKS